MTPKVLKPKDYKIHNENSAPYYRFLSYDEKFEKDAEWFTECVNYCDNMLGFTNTKYLTKLDVNYAIAKGKNGVLIYNELMKQRSLNAQDSVPADVLKRKNYDILSPIFKSSVGEQQKRPLNIIARDYSPYNVNMRKKKHTELYQEWVMKNYNNPILQSVTMEIMQKHNIADPKTLNPEEQDQIKSEIEALRKFKTPKDIDKFMRDEYTSETETQLQEIANWAKGYFNIKFITDESFKHLFCSGREISYTTIQNFKPIAKILNPKGFSYVGKDNSYFISEGEIWRYEEFITYSEFIKDIPMDSNIMEQLQKFVGSFSGGTGSVADQRRILRGEPPGIINEAMASYNIATNGGLLTAVPDDLGSREGQSFMSKMYRMFGNSIIEPNKIRKTNTCWTGLDKVYYVERIGPDGKKKFYWLGENYETNPELDINVVEHWVPAYYQADNIGYSKDFVYNKKRVEFQNRSMSDPYDIIPPYDGIEYSRMFNNAEITAPLDFGKVLQDEYNEVKEKISELDETNVGKIFLLPETLLPDNTKTEDWIADIKRHKLGIINAESSSLNPAIAAQILKSIDLGNNQDIAGYQGRLQAIKYEAEQVMCYSPSSLGQAPASITATANQQNIVQTSYKTEDIYSLHDVFVSRFVSNIVLTIKNAMINNEDLREALLTIPSLAALNINYELLAETIPTIHFVSKSQEVDDIKNLKNLLQPMIQNQLANKMSTVAKIQFMDNPASLINMMEDEERSMEERAQAAQERELAEAEKERKLKWDMFMEQQNLAKYKIDKDSDTKLAGINESARQFEYGADADNNNEPDSVQVANIKAKADIEKANIAQETKKMELDAMSKQPVSTK